MIKTAIKLVEKMSLHCTALTLDFKNETLVRKSPSQNHWNNKPITIEPESEDKIDYICLRN